MPKMTRIVQVTDLHLMREAGATTFSGVVTAQTAARVFRAIGGLNPAPDLVVATGDLTNDGEVESYRLLRRLTDGLPCPRRCALGNHDVRRAFRSGWAGESMPDDSPLDYVFDLNGIRNFVLDTTIPGEAGGALDASQIVWLEKEVSAAGSAPKLFFLHHHPVEIGSPWMDRMMLSNADDLFRAIEPGFETTLGIFFGHVHQDFETEWKGVPVRGTRSTCMQFTPNTEEFTPSDQPPGYRLIEIREGRLETHIVPVEA